MFFYQYILFTRFSYNIASVSVSRIIAVVHTEIWVVGVACWANAIGRIVTVRGTVAGRGKSGHEWSFFVDIPPWIAKRVSIVPRVAEEFSRRATTCFSAAIAKAPVAKTLSCVTYLQKHKNLQANSCCCTRLWGKISPWFSITKACTRVTRAVGVSCDCGRWSDRRCSGRDDFPDSLWAAFERWDVGSRWEAVWLPIHVRLKATAWLLHSSKLHNVTILMIWFNETLIKQMFSKKSSNTNWAGCLLGALCSKPNNKMICRIEPLAKEQFSEVFVNGLKIVLGLTGRRRSIFHWDTADVCSCRCLCMMASHPTPESWDKNENWVGIFWVKILVYLW